MDMFFYFLINIFCLLACFVIPLIFPIKLRHILILFSAATLTNVVHLIFNLNWHTFFTIGVLVLILFFCSGRKAVNILCALTTYMLSIVLNHLLILLMASLMRTSMDTIITAYQWLFMIIFFVLLVLSAFFLRKFFKWLYDKYLTDLPNDIYIYILLEIVACAGIYILNITMTHSYQYSKAVMSASTFLYISFFAVSSLLLVLVTRTIKKDTELKIRLQQYEAMQAYTEQLEQVYAEYRTFKHDYSNILLSMSQYIDSNDLQGLSAYFHESILPTGQTLSAADKQLGRLSAIQIPAIKGILSAKLNYAISRELNICIHIPAPVTEVPIDLLDFSRILGIFLDNAIEAAADTAQKQLSLTIIHTENSTLWQIENSCDSTTIRLDQLKKSGYSTKGNNRGIGLYNASQIIDKYPNIDWDIQCSNNSFSHILTIQGV